jgi:hypothetical protein
LAGDSFCAMIGRMERRLALAGAALVTVALWWVYARHLETWGDASVLSAAVAGGACGAYISPRRWWFALLPLPALAVGGYVLSFHFSRTQPFSGGGDWSAAAVVVAGGIWCGLVATGVLLIVVTVRGALHMMLRHTSGGHAPSTPS